ncbi:MAG: anthranilate phosphoribosyltransferase [bacterium]
MSNDLKNLMSTMGTGPRSSEDLTYEKSSKAMNNLLEENFAPVTFGAFMVAMRWKSETVEELAGFLDEIRSRDFHGQTTSVDNFIDVAGRFDGKKNEVNTDLAGSLLCAVSGTPVFTHSGQNIPTKPGAATILDVVESMGWNPAPPLERSVNSLEEFGFGYANQRTYAPQLESLRPYREQLGVRSFLNTIESMVNPLNGSVHVGSFYHLEFAKRICDVFGRSETTSPEKVVMIQGMEGQTELRPDYPLIAESTGDDFNDRKIDPERLNVAFDREELKDIGPDPDTGADLCRRILTGESVPEDYRQSVVFNAGVKKYAGGDVESVKQGIRSIRELLGSNNAKKFFSRLEEVFSLESKQAVPD